MKCDWYIFVKHVSLIYRDYQTLLKLLRNIGENMCDGVVIDKTPFRATDYQTICRNVWHLFYEFDIALELSACDTYEYLFEMNDLILNSDIYVVPETFYEVELKLSKAVCGIEGIKDAMKYFYKLLIGEIAISEMTIKEAKTNFQSYHKVIYHCQLDEQDTKRRVDWSTYPSLVLSYIKYLEKHLDELKAYYNAFLKLKTQLSAVDDTFNKKYKDASASSKYVVDAEYEFKTYNYNFDYDYVSSTPSQDVNTGNISIGQNDSVYKPVGMDDSVSIVDMQEAIIDGAESEKNKLVNEFWENASYLQNLPYSYDLQAPGGVTTTVGHYLSGSQLEDLQVNFYDEFKKLAPPDGDGATYDGKDHDQYLTIVNTFYNAYKLGKLSDLEKFLETVDGNMTLEQFEDKFDSYGRNSLGYRVHNYFHDYDIKMMEVVYETDDKGRLLYGKTYFEQDYFLKMSMYVFYLVYRDDSYMQRYDAYLKEKERLEDEQQERKDRIYELSAELDVARTQKYALRQYEKEIPYLKIMETQSYKNFAAKWNLNGSFGAANCKLMGLDPNAVPREMIIMQDYLLATGGDVTKYNEAIRDKWNQLIGAKEANDFIESIKGSDGKIDINLWTNALTSLQGFKDGLENFGEGLEKIFNSEGIITENMYKMMYIQEALKPYNILAINYNVSNSIGNMAVPVATSLILSNVMGPSAALSIGKFCLNIPQIASASLMAWSSAGNTYNQAMVDGYDRGPAFVYGVATGISEATLTTVFSKIPGFKPLLNMGIIGEGVEEFIQTYVDAGFKHIILGTEIDLESLTDEAMTSFLYGCLTALIMNGGEAALKLPSKIKNAGIKSYTDLVNYFNCLQLCQTKTINGKKVIILPKSAGIDIVNILSNLNPEAILQIQNTDGSNTFRMPEDTIISQNSNGTTKIVDLGDCKVYNSYCDFVFQSLKNNALKKDPNISEAQLSLLRDKADMMALENFSKIVELENNGCLKEGITWEEAAELLMNGAKQETILNDSYLNEYWDSWNADSNGNVDVVTFKPAWAYDQFVNGNNTIGRDDGEFCMPKAEADKILQECMVDGKVDGKLLAEKLKLNADTFDTGVVMVTQTTNIDNLFLPTSDLEGSYIGYWIPGGKTGGGITEAATPQLKNNDGVWKNTGGEIVQVEIKDFR